MDTLKTKLSSNLAPKHFFAYSLSFMAYGCVITALGPLVPYLAAETGNPETQYAYLFFCRSIGFLVGAVILRLLQKKFTFHTILMASSIVLLGLQILFCVVLDLTNQGIIMFLISAFCCFLQVTVNVCVLETQKNGDLQFWMLVCHGIFGIGGLIGPIFVYFFQIYSYAVMGILIILVAPYYYVLKSPQDHNKVEQAVSKQGLLQQIKNAGHQGPYPALPHKPTRKVIGKQIEILVSFMFLIYIALECSYGSWIASYAVLEGIATKQQATKYSSIFWISITFFRFLSTCVPVKSMKKLFLLCYLFAAFSILTIILLIFDLKSFACIFSAIMFGMCYSSMFPLLLAIPTQYNLEITAGQGANFMLWAALGEGVLATLTGYMMAWFENDMLFYSMFVCGIIFLVSTHVLKNLYEKQSLQEASNPELEMKEVRKQE